MNQDNGKHRCHGSARTVLKAVSEPQAFESFIRGSPQKEDAFADGDAAFAGMESTPTKEFDRSSERNIVGAHSCSHQAPRSPRLWGRFPELFGGII